MPAERLLSLAVRHVLCSAFSGSARASERDRGLLVFSAAQWLLLLPSAAGCALRGGAVMEKLHHQPLPAVATGRCRRWSGASVVIRHFFLLLRGTRSVWWSPALHHRADWRQRVTFRG